MTVLVAILAITVVAVVAVVYGVVAWNASRDPLDRRAARIRAASVLHGAVAAVPASAFDARLRIVRSAG